MSKSRLAAALLAVLILTPGLAGAAAPETEEEKTLYALGMFLSKNVESSSLRRKKKND